MAETSKKIVMMKIGDVKPYENNPRKNDEAVEYVANSIKEFGFKNPIIVDKDHVIIAGHTRLKAAQKLGLKEVPVIVAGDLTEEQVKEFRLADNKTSEMSGWDYDLLAEEMDGIYKIDLALFGFDADSIDDENVQYSEKVDIPQYEPTGKDVSLDSLVDDFKTRWAS